MLEDVTFRAITGEEVGTAIAWAAREGWIPGLHDAACFWPQDPEGFFCAEADGEIVGTVSMVNYSDRFSFFGLFIVSPEYRAKGIGTGLYQYALRHAGLRVIGGDGVVSMIGNYEKTAGLFLHYHNARYEGIGGGAMPAGLVPCRDVDLPSLITYDAAHAPARREAFLRSWVAQPGHSGFARLNSEGEIVGYGVRRPCRTGYKIGPLFAQDRATAEMILDGLRAGIPGEPFFLDIPAPNTAAVALVKERGMNQVFATARIYSTKDPVPLPLDEIFGVTTFELG